MRLGVSLADRGFSLVHLFPIGSPVHILQYAHQSKEGKGTKGVGNEILQIWM